MAFKLKRWVVSTCLFTLITGCTSYNFTGRAIQQGNYLPAEKLKLLKTGMSRSEVKALLGDSLIAPVFQEERVDYAYTYQPPNKPVQVQSISLYFKHDRLDKIISNTVR